MYTLDNNKLYMYSYPHGLYVASNMTAVELMQCKYQ